MKEQVFVDKTNQKLIVQNRRSAIFFLGVANINKKNKFLNADEDFICSDELSKIYNFEKEEFKRLISYCEEIGKESWKTFTPKLANSCGSDYFEYYDRDFDNNGYLTVGDNTLKIEGPYTQLKSKGKIVRLIKFNKRKFESFVYDITK